MRIGYIIKRLRELPPRVSAQLAWTLVHHKGRALAEAAHDRVFSTYVPQNRRPAGELQQLFDRPTASDLRVISTAITAAAQSVMKHEVDLLGSGPTHMCYGMTAVGLEGIRFPATPAPTFDADGAWLATVVHGANLRHARRVWQLVGSAYKPIDWQLDFRSGARWSARVASRSIDPLRQPKGADVKLPWELARMQHLTQLSWAFALASSAEPGSKSGESYLQEFCDQILDFIAANPPRFGVNWVCTMDVAIRAANWVVAHDLFCALGAEFDPRFSAELVRSLYDHGRHIVSHLEWSPVLRGNHYLANVVGLMFVSAALPRSPETDRWLAWSTKEFRNELSLQFHVDGSNFEGSTAYHRLSAEMCLYATALLLRLAATERGYIVCGVLGSEKGQLPCDILTLLGRMRHFLLSMSLAPRRLSQIGDNDSGRFLKLWPFNHLEAGDANCVSETPLDASSTIEGIGELLSSSAAPHDSRRHPERLVVRLLTGHQTPSFLVETLSKSPAAFDGFGGYRLDSERMRLIFRCGPVGQLGNGGHAHNDQLSFELAIDGWPIVVDPGTYLYTPSIEQRNRFRSTAAHNTLAIAGLEQNGWETGHRGLFRMAESSHARILEWKPPMVRAEHFGFGTPHERTLILDDAQLKGVDQCSQWQSSIVHFHLAPHIAITHTANGAVTVTTPSGIFAVFKSTSGNWSIHDDSYSAGYGRREPSLRLELQMKAPEATWFIEAGGRGLRNAGKAP